MRPWISLLLLASGLSAQPARNVAITSCGDPAGRIVEPGQAITLSICVWGADGQPLAGAPVLFQTPRQGPLGLFDGSSRAWTATNENGIASVQLTANDSKGPYVASAWVADTTGEFQFALTNAAPPEFALTADAATAAVTEKLALDPQRQTLHGPFLLDTGSTLLDAGGPTGGSKQGLARTMPAPRWFFWVDDDPQAGFGHTVRYVIVDPTQAFVDFTAKDTLEQHLWWPQVQAPDALNAYSLRSPLLTSPDAEGLRPQVSARQFADNDDACAVLIYGTEEAGHSQGVDAMANLFENTVKIPAGNIIRDTDASGNAQATTPSRIPQLLASAKAKGCKKLYFYYAGHGYGPGFCPANEDGKDGSTELDYYPYDKLAQDIAATGIKEVCPIFDCCFSANAIQAFQAQGLTGVIVTSADTLNFSYRNPVYGLRGMFFTSAFADSWRKLAAIPGGPVTPNEALVRTLQDNEGSYYATAGMPQTAKIEPGTPVIALPGVQIGEPPGTVTVTIQRPADASGPLKLDIRVGDPGIATTSAGADSLRVTMAANQTTATFVLTGVKEGQTTYSVKAVDANSKVYEGSAGVSVGNPFSVAPNPIRVKSGASVSVTLQRPAFLSGGPAPVTVVVDTTDAAGATVIQPVVPVLVFAPGTTSQTVMVRALGPGTATLRFNTPGKPLLATVYVDGYTVSPNPLRLKVGDRGAVTLQRRGLLATDNVVLAAAMSTVSGDNTVAPLPGGPVVFGPGQPSATLVFEGRKAGTVRYRMTDPLNNLTVEFDVIVGDEAPAPTQTGCLLNGSASGMFTVSLDNARHDPFIRLRQAIMRWVATTSGTNPMMASLQLSGSDSQTIAATGTLDLSTCTFNATGRGTVAGFPNVTVMYRSWRIDPVNRTLMGDYLLGTGMELPTGNSITYRYSGSLQAAPGELPR